MELQALRPCIGCSIKTASCRLTCPRTSWTHHRYVRSKSLCEARTRNIRPQASTRKSWTERLATFVLPEREGDFKDYLWMSISIGVLMYFAATLYMVYEHMYYSSGMITIADFLSQQ